MDCARRRAGERGLSVEPHRVDIGPRPVELARRRPPHRADRIELGNAFTSGGSGETVWIDR